MSMKYRTSIHGCRKSGRCSCSLAEGLLEQAGAVQQLQATIANITSMVDNTAEHTKNSRTGTGIFS